MKSPYHFSVLRYVHDPITQEFINIGVVLYSPEKRYVGAMCSSKYGRISKTFTEVDGTHFRRQSEFIQARVDEFGERLAQELPMSEIPKSIEEITKSVLPPDDSSFQFIAQGSGLSDNLSKTLNELFDRYVEKYYAPVERQTRDENAVWRASFRQPLEEKQVLSHFHPHKIVAKHFEYDFNYAWKNEQWRTLQTVSFDLADGGNIIDKANTWLGRAQSLSDSKELFKLYFLMGLPSDQKLRKSFERAQNIIHKTTIQHEFVKEDEAEDFAEHLRKEI